MAFSFSPEKNKISENIKLERADINNNISVMLNFLNMYFFLSKINISKINLFIFKYKQLVRLKVKF